MPRQQQVDEALKRAFAGTDASGKVRASLVSGGRELEMYHYQHLLMRYDLDSMRPTYTWHEKPTDTRILDAALEALASGSFQRSHMKPENNSRGTKRGAGSVPDSREPVVSEEEKSLGGHFECVKVATGREVEDQGSRFIAMVAFPITSKPHAEIALSMLRAHESLIGADHRISAYRAEDGCENFDDDGEDRGGSTLRAALRKQKVIGCVGVVARWYGGRNIGKARFHHIQERIILLLSGLGHEPGSKRKSLRECVWSRAGIGKVLGGICRGNAAQNKQRSTSTIFPRASDSARSCADGTKVARYEQGAHLDVRHVRAEVMAAAAERRSGRLHADEPHRVQSIHGRAGFETAGEVRKDIFNLSTPRHNSESNSCAKGNNVGHHGVRQNSSSGLWHCEKCTFLNDSKARNCEICGTLHRHLVELEFPKKWNIHDDRQCPPNEPGEPSIDAAVIDLVSSDDE